MRQPCVAIQLLGQRASKASYSIYAFSRSRSSALARVARADISMRDLEDSMVLGRAAACALRGDRVRVRDGGDKAIRQVTDSG